MLIYCLCVVILPREKSSAESSNYSHYIHTDTHARTHTHIYTHKTWVEFWLFMHVTSFWHWFWGKCNSEEPNTTGKSILKIRKCLTWRKRC